MDKSRRWFKKFPHNPIVRSTAGGVADGHDHIAIILSRDRDAQPLGKILDRLIKTGSPVNVLGKDHVRLDFVPGHVSIGFRSP